MQTVTDLFEQYTGTKEYDGIVKDIQEWYYGYLYKASWCATSMSYMMNRLGLLDQIGGKNENVYLMMKASERACSNTGKGTFYYAANIPQGTVIPRGTIVFNLKSAPPMTETSLKHVTSAYEEFRYTGNGYFKALGGNQSDHIKIAQYYQKEIYAVFIPQYASSEAPTKSPSRSDLRRGDKGEGVKELQKALNDLGFSDMYSNKLEVDGSFGGKTEAAVKKMQKASALTTDGIVGEKTQAKLKELLQSVTKEMGKVKTDLYVRTGPGTSFNTKGVLKAGELVEIGCRRDSWGYLPKYDGWSSLKFIEF